MSSYQEAKDAGVAAQKLVASFGASVSMVRPVETPDGWKVEVETVRPLPESIDKNLSVNGVPLVLVDQGFPSMEQVRARYRAKLERRV